MPSAEQNSPESIRGSVERVTYHNEENGYCVLKLIGEGRAREPITLVGFASSISAGEFIQADGEWIDHREFGKQFKASNIHSIQPTTAEGIEKYLGSGLIKGIGPHFAEKLVRAFGTDIFDVMDKHPEKLLRVPGLGRKRAESVATAWKAQRSIRDIMIFLQSHGVGTARAVRIYKTYGEDAVARVKENPYRLASDVHGIGFKIADQIALRMGIEKNSLVRARAGLHHVLDLKTSEGHTAFPREALLDEAVRELEVERYLVEQAVVLEIQQGLLIAEETAKGALIFLPALHRAEEIVGEEFKRLLSHPQSWSKIETEKALDWVEQKMDVSLVPLQKEAVARALSAKCLVVTGGPGTGKTTLTRAIVAILAAKGIRIALCSPTGRAAKRLSECTGREAKTIHRLLGIERGRNGFQFGRENKLPADLVILDEASMVDVSLMGSLLCAMEDGASLLLVGDADQIPSVGPGSVLRSLLDSDVIPAIRLNEIFRQAAQSRITEVAHQINAGHLPDLTNPTSLSDFYFIESAESENAIQLILEMVRTRIPKRFHLNPVKDVQVLCPIHRGSLGAKHLNAELQKALNPHPSARTEKFGITYGVGDKVMVTVNDYDKEVFNGDIGFIEALDAEEETARVNFDGRAVEFEFSELDTLQLAYATTIHKSQGSEYPCVILPITTQHYMMLKRNLIYTAVTRGKKLVIMIGQKKALGVALHAAGEHRWGLLAERVRRQVLSINCEQF